MIVIRHRFGFYRWDNRGLIFHDTTYPAFFFLLELQAADRFGIGMNMWIPKSLALFQAFSRDYKNIDFGEESFISEEHSTKDTYFLMLRGQKNILGWIRNKSDTWENAFIFQEQPVTIKEEILMLDSKKKRARLFNVIGCWEDEGGKLELQNNALKLKKFNAWHCV